MWRRNAQPASESTTTARRGLGPFTGTQLTLIVVTFAVLLMVPVGAWAVTGSNVFVTDAITGAHAKVTANGRILAAPVVDPSVTYHHVGTVSEKNGCTKVIPAVPAGDALVIKDVIVAIDTVTRGPIRADLEPGNGTTACTPAKLLSRSYYPAPGCCLYAPAASLDVGEVAIKTGHTLSVLLASPSLDATAHITVDGYIVPASDCQATIATDIGCY